MVNEMSVQKLERMLCYSEYMMVPVPLRVPGTAVSERDNAMSQRASIYPKLGRSVVCH